MVEPGVAPSSRAEPREALPGAVGCTERHRVRPLPGPAGRPPGPERRAWYNEKSPRTKAARPGVERVRSLRTQQRAESQCQVTNPVPGRLCVGLVWVPLVDD